MSVTRISLALELFAAYGKPFGFQDEADRGDDLLLTSIPTDAISCVFASLTCICPVAIGFLLNVEISSSLDVLFEEDVEISETF